jgi:hypothetical protein
MWYYDKEERLETIRRAKESGRAANAAKSTVEVKLPVN